MRSGDLEGAGKPRVTGGGRRGDSTAQNAGAAGVRSDESRPYDVFLSYAHEDTDRAEWAFNVLTARGWSVWFDREMEGGDHWRQEIDQTLDDVGCVVVLWSASSVSSTWVMDEAGEGMERGVLVPALLDDVEIPIGFRQVQTIDLVEERVAPDRAEAALVAGVANVLGRPVIEPTPPSRLASAIRRDGPLAAAILPLAIALPLLLRPAPDAVIDLDVTATEAAFVSGSEQDVTDRMLIASFDADGLASIHLPRTRTTDERVVAANGRALGLRLASGVTPSSTGTMTVESIRVPGKTRVVVAAPDSQSARISLAGTSSPVSLSVDGVLQIFVSGADTELRDFGPPKPLSIEPDPLGADLTLRGLDGGTRLVSTPVQIETLSLARVDETLETARTELAVVSTIRSGTIRFEPPAGRENTIGAGDRIRLDGVSGEIRELAMTAGALRLRFLGSVTSIESCTSDSVCESWMPSALASLMARRLPLVLAVAAMYVLVLLALIRQRLRVPARIVMIAIALTAAGTPDATAQSPVQDPDESVKRLVVRVESAVGFGSGIIAGARADTLFIATANHVVRRGPTAADSVDVRFYWQPDVPVRAALLPSADDSLDLALLSVSPLSAVPTGDDVVRSMFDPRGIPFDRLADRETLERGDPIWLLGQPNGLPWRINSTPERFIGFRGESLDFESTLLARGHSGGALLNEDREVIGMLKSDQAPYGEAVSMYAIARRIEAWGYPVDLRLRAPQLSAAQARTCVLTSRGDTRCVGHDDRYEPAPIDLELPLRQLSIRDDHACGIVKGGRAFCIGDNSNGQLGNGAIDSQYTSPVEVSGGLTFESISAGSGHTCGVVAGGDVYCWGLAEGGQLGTWFDDDRTIPVRVPATGRFRAVSAMWQYTCGLTVDGESWCWGALAGRSMSGMPPARFGVDITFTSLSAGWYQVCGITSAGETLCWGFNDDGQLGTGASDDDFHDEPLAVTGNHSFTSVSSGVSHTCGVTAGGEMWCWGLNSFGQLGDGTTESRSVPVRVTGGHVFESVSAGALHTCGVTTGAEVWCWGDNELVASHEGGGIRPGGEPHYLEPVLTMTLDSADRTPWRR